MQSSSQGYKKELTSFYSRDWNITLEGTCIPGELPVQFAAVFLLLSRLSIYEQLRSL